MSAATAKIEIGSGNPQQVRLHIGGRRCDGGADHALVLVLVSNKYRNCGQVCIAPVRFLAEKPVRDIFLQRLAEFTGEVRVGRGGAEETAMGPIAKARRCRRARGAAGIRRPTACGGGFPHAPTVLANSPVDARCVNEEPFDPIAIVNAFDTLDKAIAEVNRLSYGLAAYASTDSTAARLRLTWSIESWMISFNHHRVGLPETSFRGINDSGYGSEEDAEARPRRE